MASVTLTDLHELPTSQLEHLIRVLAHERNTTAATTPRVASVFMALLDGLTSEQKRRQESELPHSARVLTVPLPMAGELLETEMEALMRWLVRGRTSIAGGTPAAARVFESVLAALHDTRMQQQETLAHMDGDLADRT
jgi:hypothetical protein